MPHYRKGNILTFSGVWDKEGIGGQCNDVQFALVSVTESFIFAVMVLSSLASAYQLHFSERALGGMRKGKENKRKFFTGSIVRFYFQLFKFDSWGFSFPGL